MPCPIGNKKAMYSISRHHFNIGIVYTMVKNAFYYLEQTPPLLAKDLIETLHLRAGLHLLEPFKGEGGFYSQFPTNCVKDYAEIEEGRDYKDTKYIFDKIDWVITNPPFRIINEKGKDINAFYALLEYYSNIATTGIAFLANDKCFSSLTPVRMKALRDKGWYLSNVIVCAVKKWRGRYFWVVFTKTPSDTFRQLNGNY